MIAASVLLGTTTTATGTAATGTGSETVSAISRNAQPWRLASGTETVTVMARERGKGGIASTATITRMMTCLQSMTTTI